MREHDADIVSRHFTVSFLYPPPITRYLSYCLGNAVKNVLCASHNGGRTDLLAALVYLAWERAIPGPALPHHIYARVESDIDGVVNNFAHPRSGMDDLQASFLILLDSYLSSGDSTALPAMQDAVRRMLELPEIAI